MTRHLSPVALDFLWESLAAGEMPYPLELRSHGTTVDERNLLRRQVFADVDAEDLSAWLAVLARPTESVDCVFEGTAALAATDGHEALLAVQNGAGLSLTRVDRSSLTSEVVALLPPHPRGKEKSITIPASDLVNLSAGHLTDRQVLRALADQPKLRAGQLAVNTRNTVGTRRRSPVLSWFDTPTGRYLTYTNRAPDGTDWITIAPADAPTLRHRLGELLLTLGAPAR